MVEGVVDVGIGNLEVRILGGVFRLVLIVIVVVVVVVGIQASTTLLGKRAISTRPKSKSSR
jgi:hypothetical protein